MARPFRPMDRPYLETEYIGRIPPSACNNVTSTLHGWSHIVETSFGCASDVLSSRTLGTGHTHRSVDRFVSKILHFIYCEIYMLK